MTAQNTCAIMHQCCLRHPSFRCCLEVFSVGPLSLPILHLSPFHSALLFSPTSGFPPSNGTASFRVSLRCAHWVTLLQLGNFAFTLSSYFALARDTDSARLSTQQLVACQLAGASTTHRRTELLHVTITMTMTMTMAHSEKSHIRQMKAWPCRQECRFHDPAKKNLLCW